MNKHTAHIIEIFSSLQGEGIYAGEQMTFVRFGRCNMRCVYCDTLEGICHQDNMRVETQPASGNFKNVENPVSATALTNLVQGFDNEFISITGGEPLEQVDFLEEWLPSIVPQHRILLETNGILHKELSRVLSFVHVISMDIKLPSSTRCKPKWTDHTSFLKKAVAAGREIYVKFVVTANTTDADIQKSIGIITKINKFIPIVIQPATPTLTFHHPISEERLKAVERLCSAYLDDVRVIPQMHKQWGVL
ncbi:MAG: 7-carboxy-7-deazaguanine synthase QueE [Pseudomonadota bacterium]